MRTIPLASKGGQIAIQGTNIQGESLRNWRNIIANAGDWAIVQISISIPFVDRWIRKF